MLAFFAIAGLAFAQAPPPPPYIQAFGEGVVAVAPDQAHIAVGVVTQAATAEAAGTQNAERADAVIRELRRVAGPNAEIRTAGYSLEPMYRSPRDAAPEISGYTARNTVLVTTSDLKSVGPIIDAAMKAGANNIQRLEFSLKDQRAARAQALKEAAAAARADAEAIASALGVRIVRVLSAEAGGEPPIRPMVMSMARMEAAAATPIEPGTVEVRAAVTLRVEVAR